MGRENRIGHFNPSIQGPNEPPSSAEMRAELLEEDVEMAQDQIDNHDKKINQYQRAIEENQRMLERELARKVQAEGTLAETREWLKEAIEYVDSLKSQRSSVLNEIELLEEDPGNEERIEQLRKRLVEINYQL